MTGKSIAGLISLILGPIGVLLSIALLVFTITHSPNIDVDQALAADPSATYVKQPYYLWFLIIGWSALFLGILLTVMGIVLMVIGANRRATPPPLA